MMTDKQLKALMRWTVNGIEAARPNREAFLAQEQFRAELYEAFGFVEGPDLKPVVPTHPQTLPPANFATSDPEGHRQAQKDALCMLTCKYSGSLDPDEIINIWPELKAIMEPNNDAK